jgi:hypothetical protein
MSTLLLLAAAVLAVYSLTRLYRSNTRRSISYIRGPPAKYWLLGMVRLIASCVQY